MKIKRFQIKLVVGLVLLLGTVWFIHIALNPAAHQTSAADPEAAESLPSGLRGSVTHAVLSADSIPRVRDRDDPTTSPTQSASDWHPLLRQLLPDDYDADDVATLATLGLADLLEAAEGMAEPAKTEQVTVAMRQLEALRRDAGRRRAEELGLPLRQELPDGRVREVVGINEHGYPLYYATRNVSAGISTGANVLQAAPYQLTGENLVLGVWDGGSGRTTHNEFAGGRLSNMNNVGSIDHATHVAGTMIAAGANASALGMAPAATVDSYDWFNDLTEMLNRGASAPNATDAIYISNHSYGYIRGWYWNGSHYEWHGGGSGPSAIEGAFGRYNTFARDADALVFSRPYYTVFWSAGNDRSSNPGTGSPVALSPGASTVPYDPNQHPPGDGVYRGGYDIIGDHAIGKNVITVGAVTDAVSGGQRNPNAADMAWFSSWGPTDDGRIKPDLVANGVSVFSAGNDNNSDYYSSSGTSMSSPNAAGTAALLIEQYKQHFPDAALRASTLRGLLIHTADDLGTPGPNYQYGWGLVNGLAAGELIDDYATRPGSIRLTEDSISAANRPLTYEALWDGESPIRVTLAWTDPAGPATPATDDRTSRLVNNLDVKVIGPDGTEYLPWVMPFVGTWTEASMSEPATTGTNNTDNVEQVFIAEPTEPGIYTIVVNYQGTLSNSPQAYSLLVSGMDTPTDPADVLQLDADLDFGEVRINTEKERIISLYNAGPQTVTVTNIVVPAGFSATWSGTVPAGSSRDVVVRFSPLSSAQYDGQLRLQLDDTASDLSTPMTATGVRYLAITNPPDALTVSFNTSSYDVAGEADATLAGVLTWTNTGTGASDTLPADETWQANNVALAEGANLFTISGTNNPMDTFIAEDSAGATWSEGENGGYGFNAWGWTTTGVSAGHFIATSENNANLDINSPAWGLWANSGHHANAFRPLAEPLQVGDTFRVTLENNQITTGNSAGMALLNPDGEYLFEFFFVGGAEFYVINDHEADFITTLPYTNTGVELALTRTGEESYDLTANGLTLISRTFASRSNMEITRFRAFNKSAGPGSNHDFFFNNLSVERSAGDPVSFSDQVEITRLSPPPDVPELFLGSVEAASFEAYWMVSPGATSYVFDVHTDESFVNAVTGTGGAEDFSDTGPASSTFRTITWTNNEVVWTAYRARNSDIMTGPALTLENQSGAYFVSEAIPEGVDQIAIDYTRPAAGGPNPVGTFSIYVNDQLKGGPYTLQNDTQTAVISGIGETGPATIMITNSGARIATFDNLTWTNEASVVGAFVPGYSNLTTTATNVTVTGLDAGTEYFLRVKAVSENGESDYAVTNATTLGQARNTQTITFDSIEGDIVTTNVVELSATASSELPVTFHVDSGPAIITNGNQVIFSASGGVTISAKQEGNAVFQPAQPVSRSFFVNQAVPVIITGPEASDLIWGQSLADSTLSGGAADADGRFDWLDDSIVPPGGVSTQTVVFLPEETNIYTSAETEVAVTVQFASLEIDPVDKQIVALDPLGSTNLVYTLTNSGNASLEWSVELLAYDFFDDMEQGTNNWTVGGDNARWSISTNRAVVGSSSWYSGYTASMFSRTVTPSIRLHTNEPSLVFDHWIDAEIMSENEVAYHGGLVALSVDGINYVILEPDGGYPYTLDGSSWGVFSGSNDWSSATFDLSNYAGEQVWLAFYFITDNVYTGNEEGWYVDGVAISPRQASDDWITLSAETNTVPPESAGTWTAQLAAPAPLVGATRQAVVTFESNNAGNPIQTRSIQLQVNKNQADVTLEDLTQFYDGTPKTPTAVTDPSGLNVVFTYDGSPAPPVEVGDYTVVATVDDPAWAGVATGTLSIVELRGAIDVADSILPADDLDMPFGDVFVGQERIEQITIFNTNLVDELTVMNVVIGEEPVETSTVKVTASAVADTPSARELRRAALESDAPRAPDTILVRFASQAESVAARNAVHALMGTERRHRYRTIPVEVVELPPGTDLTEMIAAYEARPDVEYAEPNFMYAPLNTPDDPSFDQLWGLHNTGQSGGTPGADISALDAWATTTGSSNVIVAVIDTGIDYTHPDLAANMWSNPNPTFGDVHGARFVSGNGQPTNGDPMDDHSHGTHVAGTIGAIGDNGIGVAGVAWNVRLMGLKFITSSNQGSLADAIAAIEYAIEHGAHLSNNSWGGGGYSQALKDAIEAAGNANQLFVAAAGNENNNNDNSPAYPATYDLPNIISVANSTRTDARSGLSNYGANSVHVAAPGTAIYSTVLNSSYGNKSGTSMAAPHVAGTAALLLSLHENAPYAQLKKWILSSVTPLSNWDDLVITGGRLNAAQAIATSLENGFSVAHQPSLPVMIPPGESVTLDIRFRPPAYTEYTNTLRIINNDLDRPEVVVVLSGTGTSVPPEVTLLDASQTSTNGTGQVTLDLEVFDPDSPAVDLAVQFSIDDGITWSNAWIAAADGNIITNDAPPQVRGVEAGAGTNMLAVVWSTVDSPAITLATSTLVRVRGWDGVVWGAWSESAHFLVDNEPPHRPTNVQLSGITPQQWTNQIALTATWDTSDDGQGVGIDHYVIEVRDNELAYSTFATTQTLQSIDGLADGTNWTVNVRAVDSFGNTSDDGVSPRYWFDYTPPVASAAELNIIRSAFGDYTLSATLTNTWSGFADDLSGLAGFYVSVNDDANPAQHLWTTATNAVITGAIMDQENHVYVWAQDHAGNISLPISDTILVLNPEGILPGRQLTNQEMEVAGLDAATGPEEFSVRVDQQSLPSAEHTSVRWPYAAGRTYTIHRSEDPLSAQMVWTSQVITNYVVDDGWAVWVDPEPISSRRYYRIEVELE